MARKKPPLFFACFATVKFWGHLSFFHAPLPLEAVHYERSWQKREGTMGLKSCHMGQCGDNTCIEIYSADSKGGNEVAGLAKK